MRNALLWKKACTLLIEGWWPDMPRLMLRVDIDHLIDQMMAAVESPELSRKARAVGPAFVAAGYTWRHVTAKLLEILFGKEAL
jgi:hypothetical protein